MGRLGFRSCCDLNGIRLLDMKEISQFIVHGDDHVRSRAYFIFAELEYYRQGSSYMDLVVAYVFDGDSINFVCPGRA